MQQLRLTGRDVCEKQRIETKKKISSNAQTLKDVDSKNSATRYVEMLDEPPYTGWLYRICKHPVVNIMLNKTKNTEQDVSLLTLYSLTGVLPRVLLSSPFVFRFSEATAWGLSTVAGGFL